MIVDGMENRSVRFRTIKIATDIRCATKRYDLNANSWDMWLSGL